MSLLKPHKKHVIIFAYQETVIPPEAAVKHVKSAARIIIHETGESPEKVLLAVFGLPSMILSPN
jgi:hypothetical protein